MHSWLPSHPQGTENFFHLDKKLALLLCFIYNIHWQWGIRILYKKTIGISHIGVHHYHKATLFQSTLDLVKKAAEKDFSIFYLFSSVWHHTEYALHGVFLHEVGSQFIFQFDFLHIYEYIYLLKMHLIVYCKYFLMKVVGNSFCKKQLVVM